MITCPLCQRQIHERGAAQHQGSAVCEAAQSDAALRQEGWVLTGIYLGRLRQHHLPMKHALGLGGAGGYMRGRRLWWTRGWAYDLLHYCPDDEQVKQVIKQGPQACRRTAAAMALQRR